MSISAEEKVCYLREAAIVRAKEGFQLDEVHTDRLCILLDGAPLCEVTESGGIAYRNKDIDEPERIAAKDKVYEIVRTTAEYMRQMETAPVLKADGLEDGYKVLADFNGTVLAGVQSKHGVHFVTWDWASNDFAEALEDIWQQDGALLTYAAVLEAEKPETLHHACELLRNLDNYQRITEDAYGYGQQRLQETLGLDDEAIYELEGYMDFEQYGQDCMENDGVTKTEFGLLRRLDPPFPEQRQGQRMM